MGVPVVTLVGKRHGERSTYSILANLGVLDDGGARRPRIRRHRGAAGHRRRVHGGSARRDSRESRPIAADGHGVAHAASRGRLPARARGARAGGAGERRLAFASSSERATSAARTSATTLAQSPGCGCRKSRAVGYQRTVGPVESPAPVGRERQQYPHRLAERTREMRVARVHADDEIEAVDQRGLSARSRCVHRAAGCARPPALAQSGPRRRSFCSENQAMSGSSSSGTSAASGHERRRSLTCRVLPAHERPDAQCSCRRRQSRASQRLDVARRRRDREPRRESRARRHPARPRRKAAAAGSRAAATGRPARNTAATPGALARISYSASGARTITRAPRRRKRRREAHELQRVAETLFGGKEHACGRASASPCQRGAEDVAAAPKVCARCRHSYSRQPSRVLAG